MEDEDFCWLRECQTGLVMLEAVVGTVEGVIADRSWWERQQASHATSEEMWSGLNLVDIR